MTKLLFIGDIHSDKELSNDWLSPEIKKIIKKHTFVSCNYEGTTPVLHSMRINKIGPHLSQSEELLAKCHSAGINHYNLANNHVMDHGLTGLTQLISEIKNYSDSFGGARLNPENLYDPVSIKDNDITIDIFSGCESDHGIVTSDECRPGVAWINDPLIDRNIVISKRKKHFVIVQAHGGEETSLPLPEWKARYHALIDLGADIVVAHHPHVPQGWETYHGKRIYYSLGNFLFYNSLIPSSSRGIMLSIEVKKGGKYLSRVYPIRVVDGRVSIHKNDINILNELSRQIISKDYLQLANNQAMSLWNKYYSHYFSNSITQSRLKPFIKSNYNYPLIVHNIKIESHRWTIIRAIEQIMQTNSL